MNFQPNCKSYHRKISCN